MVFSEEGNVHEIVKSCSLVPGNGTDQCENIQDKTQIRFYVGTWNYWAGRFRRWKFGVACICSSHLCNDSNFLNLHWTAYILPIIYFCL